MQIVEQGPKHVKLEGNKIHHLFVQVMSSFLILFLNVVCKALFTCTFLIVDPFLDHILLAFPRSQYTVKMVFRI